MTVADWQERRKLLQRQIMAAAEALAEHAGGVTEIVIPGDTCSVVVKVKRQKRKQGNAKV